MAIKEPPATAVGDKGLQAGALGLVGNIVIGLAAVAPAYSLAATLGYVVLAVGEKAPSMFVHSAPEVTIDRPPLATNRRHRV